MIGLQRFSTIGLTLGLVLGVGGLAGGCPLNQLQDALDTGDATDDAGTGDAAAAANEKPAVDAGPDVEARAGDLVVLDGSKTRDADGDRVTFFWRQTSGNPRVFLTNGFSSNPRFFAPEGLDETLTLTFELVAADGTSSATDAVVVTIAPTNSVD